MGVLAFSGFLNRLVRVDSPQEQGRATVRLIKQALESGNRVEATELTEYLLLEQEIGHEIFARWTERMAKYLMEYEPRQTLREVHATTMQPWLATTVAPYFSEFEPRVPQLESRDEQVRYSWNGTVHVELDRRADTYPLEVFYQKEKFAPVHRLDDSMRAALALDHPARAYSEIDAIMYRNRLVHEIYCDWCWALLTNIRDTYGEARFGAAMRETMEDWVTVRYKDLMNMSPEELLQLTVEGLRGEFFGAELLGDVEVTEEADRYVLAFDPCGTGGRMRRGVPQLGTPPRTDPPYNFGVSHTAQPWSWNRQGVCLYCAHCADINELLPLDRIGRPMRVTEHPQNPQDKCRWFIYKQPEFVPPEIYERFGRKSPDHFTGLAPARAAGHRDEFHAEKGASGE